MKQRMKLLMKMKMKDDDDDLMMMDLSSSLLAPRRPTIHFFPRAAMDLSVR